MLHFYNETSKTNNKININLHNKSSYFATKPKIILKQLTLVQSITLTFNQCLQIKLKFATKYTALKITCPTSQGSQNLCWATNVP